MDSTVYVRTVLFSKKDPGTLQALRQIVEQGVVHSPTPDINEVRA